jgi:hypothetical protein
MSSAIELLELRVKYIEDRLIGNKCNRISNISEELSQIDSKLKELTAGKERFNNCFQKLTQLDKWLDFEYIDRILATDSTQFEQVLGFEDMIKSEAQIFEAINRLDKTIDSPHIRNYSKFEPKLNEIRFVALKQSHDSKQIEEKTKQLLLTYNQWLSVVKNQLALWDQKLSQLEDRNANKTNSNKTKVEID